MELKAVERIRKLEDYIKSRLKLVTKLQERLKTAKGFARKKYEMDIEVWKKRIKEAKEELELLRKVEEPEDLIEEGRALRQVNN